MIFFSGHCLKIEFPQKTRGRNGELNNVADDVIFPEAAAAAPSNTLSNLNPFMLQSDGLAIHRLFLPRASEGKSAGNVIQATNTRE